jgi:hypothetical protein
MDVWEYIEVPGATMKPRHPAETNLKIEIDVKRCPGITLLDMLKTITFSKYE